MDNSIIQEISSAISRQLKISFLYNKSKYRVVSPYYLVDNSYLIAHDPQNDSAGERHLTKFNLNSLEDIKTLDEETLSIAEMSEFPDYDSERLKMYTRDTTIEHMERLEKNILLDPMSKERALKEFGRDKMRGHINDK